jgi:hypothetical protein
MCKSLVRTQLMNLNTKKNLVVLIAAVLLAVGIGTTSSESASAQMSNSTMTNGSGQNKTANMMGPNITASIPIGPTIAKAIASQIHISLANASMMAEKAVGANSHAVAIRLGVIHGFLVYMALLVDSNNAFHGVLVDPGNGKVLASTPISQAAMMGMGLMMGPGMGLMMGPGMGLMQHGTMGPGKGFMRGGMMQHGTMGHGW